MKSMACEYCGRPACIAGIVEFLGHKMTRAHLRECRDAMKALLESERLALGELREINERLAAVVEDNHL